MFSTGHSKGLPGGEESIIYPGTYDYLAGAIIHSAKTGIPLLNDIPDLPIPGLPGWRRPTTRSCSPRFSRLSARGSRFRTFRFCGQKI